jgi:hypothetical protein
MLHSIKSTMQEQARTFGMPFSKPAENKFHWRAQGPPFELTALLLQGGGALGSYQAGVYQALAEADLHPDWVAGHKSRKVPSSLAMCFLAWTHSDPRRFVARFFVLIEAQKEQCQWRLHRPRGPLS